MRKGQAVRPWSAEDIERIQAMKDDGVLVQDIAKAVNRTQKAVFEKLVRIGSGRPLSSTVIVPWSAQEVEQLKFLRNTQRRSWGEIAKIMGRPSGTVYSKHNYLTNLSSSVGCAEQSNTLKIPEETRQEWRHRQSLDPRNLTAAFCGDPLPGFSALEKRA